MSRVSIRVEELLVTNNIPSGTFPNYDNQHNAIALNIINGGFQIFPSYETEKPIITVPMHKDLPLLILRTGLGFLISRRLEQDKEYVSDVYGLVDRILFHNQQLETYLMNPSVYFGYFQKHFDCDVYICPGMPTNVIIGVPERDAFGCIVKRGDETGLFLHASPLVYTITPIPISVPTIMIADDYYKKLEAIDIVMHS